MSTIAEGRRDAVRWSGAWAPRESRASLLEGRVLEISAERGRRRGIALYGLLGALTLAYVAVLVVHPSAVAWTWFSGWGVAVLEAAAAGLCLSRGLSRRADRTPTLLLGAALGAWALGQALSTLETTAGQGAVTPSWADLGFLAFYPLAYVATVSMLQRGLGRLARPNWLDGAIAGLGAAALSAAFAFHRIIDLVGGTPVVTTIHLMYPIGDLILLALTFAGTVLLTGRWTRSWQVLALGLAVIVAGDTFNLFNASGTMSQLASVIKPAAWPVGVTLMSLSVWMAPQRVDRLAAERASGMGIPVVAAVVSLALLALGNAHPISPVAMALAIATLVVAGGRFTLSAHRLRLMTEERHRQANTDELTGLANRRHLDYVLDCFFDDAVVEGLAPRTLAFLFVDLNRFKEINDSFGHPAGDEVLRQLGPRLAEVVGPRGTVARVGGDEFAVALPDADRVDAERLAEELVAAIAQPISVQRVTASVGASVGIAMVPDDAQESNALRWCGDVAMYRAKVGKAPYVFFDQALDGDESQIRVVEELARAIDEGALVLHYQPQLDLASGKVEAVEALVRWPHPRFGMIAPLKFLPLAEESGLIGPLTTWVLDEAVREAARWRARGTELAVAVNVSATTLLEPGFVDEVASTLARHGLPGHDLVVEITESTVIADFERSRAVIEALHGLEVVVSIDDFGAGVTSLAYLASLEVGELKLDRSFITGLGDPERGRDLELVRATINLGHEMGMRVVAEGIEDVTTLERLADLGCDIAQGYYISRPAPPERLSLAGLARRPQLALRD